MTTPSDNIPHADLIDEVATLRERLNNALKCYDDLQSVAGRKYQEYEIEVAELRTAFDLAADSRNLWRKRAMDAGWRPGQPQAARQNTHCSNCGDTRGGPVGHEISECTWDSKAAAPEVTR